MTSLAIILVLKSAIIPKMKVTIVKILMMQGRNLIMTNEEKMIFLKQMISYKMMKFITNKEIRLFFMKTNNITQKLKKYMDLMFVYSLWKKMLNH